MQNLSGKRTESKKIQKKNSRGTKKAVRRNEKIPEVRFFAVFFNKCIRIRISVICRKIIKRTFIIVFSHCHIAVFNYSLHDKLLYNRFLNKVIKRKSILLLSVFIL